MKVKAAGGPEYRGGSFFLLVSFVSSFVRRRSFFCFSLASFFGRGEKVGGGGGVSE